MKSSLMILFAAVLAFSAVVRCFDEAEPAQDDDQEEEFQPRFLAVFLETEGDSSWNDTETESESESSSSSSSSTKVNLTGHAINDVLPRVHNRSLDRVENLLGNLSAVNKFEGVLSRLGYDNETSEVGSGSTDEETTKFRNILTTLENSTLSNSTLTKVEEILGNIESGDGFAMYRV